MMVTNSFPGIAPVKVVTWLKWCLWIACSGLLIFLLVGVYFQFITPPPAGRLLMVRDIPLPGAFPDAARTAENPYAPGTARLFDHFDFQTLDPETHLLFIAHTGPNPDREQQINPNFDPDKDTKNDGNVIVFDTQQQKIVGLLNIPQVAGIVAAPDLHKVYAADSNDNIIYVINEQTLQTKQIALQNNDSPDDLWYDQASHLVVVSNPGTPASPDASNVIERKNQNETFINTLTDKVAGRIPLGIDGKWGDDVGHVRYDPGLHRAFVVVQQLPDPDSTDPNILPPPGTAWLVEMDPLTQRTVSRLRLPNFCLTPHGMALDPNSHIAFIACVDSEPASILRVDVQSMETIAEAPYTVLSNPDMLTFDRGLHLLYVASAGGITLFHEDGKELKWLGNYTFGVNTHSLAVDESTHTIYIPLPRMGGRPVLRIMRYNSSQYGE
jgi:hypothetical protein